MANSLIFWGGIAVTIVTLALGLFHIPPAVFCLLGLVGVGLTIAGHWLGGKEMERLKRDVKFSVASIARMSGGL